MTEIGDEVDQGEGVQHLELDVLPDRVIGPESRV